MEIAIITSIIQQFGLPGATICLLLYALRLLWKSHESHRRDYKEIQKQISSVVEKNTEALTTMSEAIRQISHKI